MREADRRLQWCPHRRTTITYAEPTPAGKLVTIAGNAAVQDGAQIEIGTCIASQCSQWRWDGEAIERVAAPVPDSMTPLWERLEDGGLGRPEPTRPPNMPANFIWRPALLAWTRPWPAGEREGHCGLAGSAPHD